jgi:hypothetical protein
MERRGNGGSGGEIERGERGVRDGGEGETEGGKGRGRRTRCSKREKALPQDSYGHLYGRAMGPFGSAG